MRKHLRWIEIFLIRACGPGSSFLSRSFPKLPRDDLWVPSNHPPSLGKISCGGYLRIPSWSTHPFHSTTRPPSQSLFKKKIYFQWESHFLLRYFQKHIIWHVYNRYLEHVAKTRHNNVNSMHGLHWAELAIGNETTRRNNFDDGARSHFWCRWPLGDQSLISGPHEISRFKQVLSLGASSYSCASYKYFCDHRDFTAPRQPWRGQFNDVVMMVAVNVDDAQGFAGWVATSSPASPAAADRYWVSCCVTLHSPACIILCNLIACNWIFP